MKRQIRYAVVMLWYWMIFVPIICVAWITSLPVQLICWKKRTIANMADFLSEQKE